MSIARKLDWLLILLVFLLFYELWCTRRITEDLGKPHIGVLLHQSGDLNTWQVKSGTPDWWPGMVNPVYPLQYGDIIWQKGSHCFPFPEIPPAISAIVLGKIPPDAQTLSFTIQRGDQCINLENYPLHKVTGLQIIDLWLPNFIIWLGFWFLGLTIWWTAPLEPINRSATVFFSLAGALFSQESVAIFEFHDLSHILIIVVSTIIRCMLPVSMVYFAIFFPSPILIKYRRLILTSLFLGCFVVTLGYLTAYLTKELTGQPENLIWFQISSFLDSAGLMIIILRAVSVVFFNKDKRQQWKSSILSISILLTVPFFTNYAYAVGAQGSFIPLLLITGIYTFFGFTFSPALRHQHILHRLFISSMVSMLVFGPVLLSFFSGPRLFFRGLDLRYLVMFVPLGFTYVIIRYKSFRGSDLALSAMYIMILSALASGILASTIDYFYPMVFSSPPFHLIFSSSFLSGLLFTNLGSVNGVLGRLTKRDQWNLQVVKDFGDHIAGKVDLANLPADIIWALKNTLKVSPISYWHYQPEIGFTLVETSSDHPVIDRKVLPPGQLPGKPILLNSLKADQIPTLALLQQATDLKVAAALIAPDTGEQLGLLAFGARDNEESIDHRDVEIVDMIIQQCALQLRSAEILADREIAYRYASEAEKHERTRIARELHDTTSQYFSGQGKVLEAVREILPTKPQRALDMISTSISETYKATSELRKIITSLAIEKFSGDSVKLLREAVEDFRRYTGLEVEAQINLPTDHPLTQGQHVALYRVLRQCLDNIAVHADAKKVSIEITQRNDRVEFHIIDDGCGFTPERRAEALQDHHFGLWSMESRIHDLNGKITFHSAPGQGTKIRGYIPLEPAKE